MNYDKLKKFPLSEARLLCEAGYADPFDLRLYEYNLGQRFWRDFTWKEVIAVRKKYNLSQDMFAHLMGVTKTTVRVWEEKPKFDIQPYFPYKVRQQTTMRSVSIALTALDRMGEDFFCLMHKRAPDGRNEPYLPSTIKETRKPTPTTFHSSEIRTLRNTLGLTRRELAYWLQVTPNTVDKWENDTNTPKGPSLLILQILWEKGLDGLPAQSRLKAAGIEPRPIDKTQ